MTSPFERRPGTVQPPRCMRIKAAGWTPLDPCAVSPFRDRAPALRAHRAHPQASQRIPARAASSPSRAARRPHHRPRHRPRRDKQQPQRRHHVHPGRGSRPHDPRQHGDGRTRSLDPKAVHGPPPRHHHRAAPVVHPLGARTAKHQEHAAADQTDLRNDRPRSRPHAPRAKNGPARHQPEPEGKKQARVPQENGDEKGRRGGVAPNPACESGKEVTALGPGHPAQHKPDNTVWKPPAPSIRARFTPVVLNPTVNCACRMVDPGGY